MDKIRQRTDATAKGLAAVGTAAVSAIGYTKLADVFPWVGLWGWTAAIFAGAALMVSAVIVLVLRFSDASQSVATTSDERGTFELNSFSEAEKQIVTERYTETAELNGVETLNAYQARAHRFERIAERLGDPEGGKLQARADLILAEVLMVQSRVGALIIRKRATTAVFGRGTAIWLILFVVGWYGTALGADALSSKRTDEVANAKACAEARAADEVVESKIPESVCGRPETKAPEKVTTAKAAREALKALYTAKVDCLNSAEKDVEPATPCTALQNALAAGNSP